MVEGERVWFGWTQHKKKWGRRETSDYSLWALHVFTYQSLPREDRRAQHGVSRGWFTAYAPSRSWAELIGLA